jgi:hypothetical protein
LLEEDRDVIQGGPDRGDAVAQQSWCRRRSGSRLRVQLAVRRTQRASLRRLRALVRRAGVCARQRAPAWMSRCRAGAVFVLRGARVVTARLAG